MGQEIIRVIEQIGREKGIDKQVLIEAVEAAIVSAARKKLDTQENLEAHLDPENGEMELVCLKTVVAEVKDPEQEVQLDEIRQEIEDVEIGDEVEIKKDNFPIGRIAAQTAKQVIMQKVREAERDMIYNHFHSRIGQLLTGRVNRIEKGDIYIDLDKGEAVLPRKEQTPRDFYKKGDPIRVYLLDTFRSTQGTQVIVSRTHPELLIRLFEVEVPEIAENIIEIIKAEREPGGRAKICVRSKDPNVDPVGACVGIKGSRVQSVVRELKGENIDIIEWTDDPKEFIKSALNPATVEEIVLDEETKHVYVTVAEDQLSLAIGKKGQNVRLACRLTGWQIDISNGKEKPENSNYDQETAKNEETKSDLYGIEGIDEKTVLNLIEAGIDSVEKLKQSSLDDVKNISTIELELAERIWNSISSIGDDTKVEDDTE